MNKRGGRRRRQGVDNRERDGPANCEDEMVGRTTGRGATASEAGENVHVIVVAGGAAPLR